MKFAALNKYVMAFWKFLAIVFIFQVSFAVWRLSGYDPYGLETLLGPLFVIVIIWAGWVAVRNYGFSLKETAFVGFLLSFGTHWALPIFYGEWEVLYYFLINSVIYVTMTIFGGWLARKFKLFSAILRHGSR